jgi:hypothetical protein
MNTKERNNRLMQLADDALDTTKALFKEGTTDIYDSYNGQISAFGVAIAMSGLRPALAIYYQDGKAKVNRRAILTIIAKMISDDKDYDKTFQGDNEALAKGLLTHALSLDNNGLSKLQREVIDCSIALKQVVRTYNLVAK